MCTSLGNGVDVAFGLTFVNASILNIFSVNPPKQFTLSYVLTQECCIYLCMAVIGYEMVKLYSSWDIRAPLYEAARHH